MNDGYFLVPSKARLCRRFGTLFLVAAAYWAVGLALGVAAPGFRLLCERPRACEATIDPVSLLGEDEQTAIALDRPTRARIEARAATPAVRAGLGLLGLLEDGPVVVVLVAVGLALRRLGAQGDRTLARAIPWLKRASRAGVLWAVVQIVAPGSRTLLLTWESSHLKFPIDLGAVPLPLLLSVAAYATAWALEAGFRAERDLADFV